MIYESGSWQVTHSIDVLFYLSKAPGDVERVETQRQKWLPLLLGALNGKLTVGLAYVKSVMPVSYEFTELPYGGDSYDGIRITVSAIVRETVTLAP